MASTPMIIRVAANIAELKANLAEGKNQIEITTAGMQKLAASLTGDKLIQQAHNIVAAVNEIGGATKLTEAEKERLNATLARALDKYQALGKEAPQAMRDLEAATRAVEPPSQTLTQRAIALGSAFGSFLGNLGAELVKDAGRALVQMGVDAFESAGKILDLSDQTGLTADTIQRMQFVADQTSSTLEKFTDASYQLGVRIAGGGSSVVGALRELGLEVETVRAMNPDQMWNTVTAALSGVEDATERNRLGQELFGKTFKGVAAGVVQGYKEIADRATVTTDEQLKALDDLADEWDKTWANIKTGVRAALGELVTAFRETDDMYAIGADGYAEVTKKKIAVTQEHTTEQKKQNEIQRDYVKELAEAKAQVDGLTAKQVAEIEAAKNLGVTTEELTRQYHLSAEAIKLVGDRVTETHTKEKEYDDWKKKTAQDYAKLQSDIRNEEGLADQKARAEEMARAQANIDGIRQQQIDAWQMELAARQKKAAEEAKLEAEAAQQLQDNVVVIGQVAAAHADAAEVAHFATETVAQGYAAVTQQIEISAEAIRAWMDLQRFTAGASAILAENPLFTTAQQYERIAALPRAGGGDVAAGHPYVVGERGPELFVPGSSGTIVPNGGGGPSVTIHIDARESFFDTPASLNRLADKVSAAVMPRMRQQGLRVPSGA